MRYSNIITNNHVLNAGEDFFVFLLEYIPVTMCGIPYVSKYPMDSSIGKSFSLEEEERSSYRLMVRMASVTSSGPSPSPEKAGEKARDE